MKKIVVFTDGSCMGNGRDNATGGIGIYFPNKELRNISKVYRHDKCTNQRTELYAILTAIRYINQKLGLDKYELLIKTDSKYSISCITEWTPGWINNNWITKSNKPVANREYIESIYKYYLKYNISFEHVEAHTNGTDPDSVYNDKADKLAVKATKRYLEEKKKSGNQNRVKKIDSKTKNKFIKSSTSYNHDTNFIIELIGVDK